MTTPNPPTPDHARTLAHAASDAIRSLNHATLPADGFPGLQHPVDVYGLLGDLERLARGLPQLLTQLSAFLQRQLQFDQVTIAGGAFDGDPLGAVGTASHALDERAVQAARDLARSLDAAPQAIAFAAHTSRAPTPDS